MPARGEVLVAIVKTPADMDIAREQYWYRIPVNQVKKLRQRQQWPPKWLALYQPKVFGVEAYQVNYYAEVVAIQEMARWQLFPNQPRDGKSDDRYCKLQLSPPVRLPQPIISQRLRRVPFIPTTWAKFAHAQEINDLWHESPLEDLLWDQFKQLKINAERQAPVRVKGKNYLLDFAIYCVDGKINVEADGDTFHTDKKKVVQDNVRENALKTEGWRTLRFNTGQLKEEMGTYCVPTILENIQNLGGLEGNPSAKQKPKLSPKFQPRPYPVIQKMGDRRQQTQQLCLVFDHPIDPATSRKQTTQRKQRKPKQAFQTDNCVQQLNLFAKTQNETV